jgi:hypothetical protein
LNTSQITLPASLQSYVLDDTFQVSLNLQLCLITADLSQEEHPASSSTFYLVREFLSNFIGGQTTSPEGSALSAVHNCLTNPQHYRIENSEIQSQEQLKVVLHLGHHMELPEFTDSSNYRK